ncbi:hypothetical protein I4Q48_16365, partial [Leptospira interrogans]|nr:hypothetical protein [Leptospira interrogans]
MMTPHSTAKAVRRLSEEALSRLLYSNEPTVDNFSLLRYKKVFKSLIADGKADEDDVASLGMVYYNLNDVSNFDKLLLEYIDKFNSIFLLSIYVMGKLNYAWHVKSEKLANDNILYWFNHKLNSEQLPLEFQLYINE